VLKKKKSNIIVIIVFTILLLIFFRKIFAKQLFFWFDFVIVEYPRRAYMAEVLRSGKLPLWIPYIYGGYPLIGSHPSFFLYPFTIVLSLFVRNNHLSSYAVEISLLFQLWLGGIATYFFLKELGVSKISSLFGSILFSFSLPTVVRTQHTGELTGLIWIPIIFYSLMKTSKEKNLLWASLSGLFIGISILGSHIQFYFYLLWVVAFFLLYEIITSKERKKLLLLAIAVITVGLFIAAPRIIPELEYSLLSARTREVVPGYAPFKTILALFTPHIFGKGTASYDYWGGYQSFWMFVEYSSYLGVISLLLLGLSYKVFNKKRIRFFFYLLGFALIFMYGKYNPLHSLIGIFLPGLRFHVRFMPFFVFASAIISSFTLDFLSVHLKKGHFKNISSYGSIGAFIIIVAVLIWHSTAFYPETGLQSYKHNTIFLSLLLFGIFSLISFSLVYFTSRGKIPSHWFQIIAITVLFLDLFVMGSYFSGKEMNPDVDYYNRNQLIRFLQQETKIGESRIDSPRYGYFYANSRSLMFRLEALDGHVANKLGNFSEFEKAFKDQENKYLDFYNVKYVVRDTIASGSRSIYLNERNSYLPRAWIVHQEKQLPDSLIISYMKSDEFLPSKEVIIPEETTINDLNKTLEKGKDSVNITVYQAENIELDVNLISDGYLVLSEHYYPGWKAYLDGKRTSIIRANYLFRAIRIPKGKHKVRLLFRPESFYMGLVLASSALMFTVVLFVFSGIKYKKKR